MSSDTDVCLSSASPPRRAGDGATHVQGPAAPGAVTTGKPAGRSCPAPVPRSQLGCAELQLLLKVTSRAAPAWAHPLPVSRLCHRHCSAGRSPATPLQCQRADEETVNSAFGSEQGWLERDFCHHSSVSWEGRSRLSPGGCSCRALQQDWGCWEHADLRAQLRAGSGEKWLCWGYRNRTCCREDSLGSILMKE